MNILPLVFSLLIIFSCLCATFINEVKSVQLIELTLEGYHHTEKAIRNAIVKRAYEKIKEESPSETKKENSHKSRVFHSRREQFPPLETSKFYLRALAKSEMQLSTHPLYEPLAELLRSLYQKNVFEKYSKIKNPEYPLIQSLIKKIQKFPSISKLSDLCPDEPELQLLYYKMLKGTNRYTEEAGIAPLAHFISLEKMDKAIHLSLASSQVLKAFFGAQITSEILEKERIEFESSQKYDSFSKEDFQALCLKDPKNSAIFNRFQPYLSDAKQLGKKKSLAKRDQFTGIGIEKELFTLTK